MVSLKKIKKVYVVVNPASGQPSPVLHTINRIFHQHGIRWDMGVTQPGNTAQLIARAREFEADVMAVYGGDGTICQLADGMLDDPIPLAIFPGGSANILSAELHVPRGLPAACMLLTKEHQLRRIDVGRINERSFLLRAGIGIEANIVESTARELKNDLGPLAYAFSAMKAVLGTKVMEFQLDMEGKTVKTKGLSCVIANSGNLGMPNVHFSPTDISDGQLDVFVIRNRNLSSLFAVVTNIVTQVNHEAIQHWRVDRIKIRSHPQRTVHYDGEILGEAEVDIHVLPQKIEIVAPIS